MKEELENKNRIDKAIQSEQAESELETVVQTLSEKGYTRSQIYKMFLSYQVDNQHKAEWQLVEKRFGDHPVMLTLDRLSG